MAEKITPRAVDYSQWFIDIVLNAKLADYSPVKGAMVIRPRGYAIWERIQAEFDRRFKETGHQNAYFPMLIPMGFLQKEKEHVEGFKPELAVVTHGGGEELEEPYCVRPTSETIIWYMYKNWIQSYRDLPLLYNQWCSVMRWEKRTRLFLRTSEFLWQEGHTAHETSEEALEETMRMLGVYKEVAERHLCLPVIAGQKSEAEKFAGAVSTFCIEAMMQDKKALQAGTSHFLGQNFGKAFDVQFQSREGRLEYAWATSWGVSTRLIGAIIMTHSDDKGLVLPPSLAPEQLVIVPIIKNDTKAAVLAYCGKLLEELKAAGIRAILDADESKNPGWKFAEHEMNGVPLRVEIGPRDMEAGKAMVARRDTGEKAAYDVAGLGATALGLLDAIQKNLYEKALAYRLANTKPVQSREDLVSFYGKDQGEDAGLANASGGFAEGLWCGDRDCEAKLKAETKVTIRCLPLDRQDHVEGSCCLCGKPAKHLAVFARNY